MSDNIATRYISTSLDRISGLCNGYLVYKFCRHPSAYTKYMLIFCILLRDLRVYVISHSYPLDAIHPIHFKHGDNFLIVINLLLECKISCKDFKKKYDEAISSKSIDMDNLMDICLKYQMTNDHPNFYFSEDHRDITYIEIFFKVWHEKEHTTGICEAVSCTLAKQELPLCVVDKEDERLELPEK
jgi:hypothetical protein